ncbi:MAG: hypothetical protein IKO05_02755 [Selenomonadaceae bacterium]|nr:hypothetical protein [Selenomonadaceae bacterium]
MDIRVVAAGMLALIGVGLYLYEPHEEPAAPTDTKIEKPASREAQGFGIIYIEKIQAAHPDGEYLDGLRATELRLRLELNEAMKVVEVPKPTPPETNEEVFDEAAWQKNAQAVISQLAELESRKKAAAEQYRKDSEPRYLEERDRIIGEFLNENLNIKLKLQNADNLRLSQEEVNELLKQLDEVEFGRNQAQKELYEKWLAEIKKFSDESVAEDEVRLKAEYEKLKAQVEAQTQKKKEDVTERNKQAMENSLRQMEDRQIRRRELLSELTEVGRERAEVEKKIFDSITDKAAMLAAVYRLEMILVRRAPDDYDKILSRHIVWNFELKSPERVGAVLVPGKNARDLTDDLIKEMNRL